MTATDAGATSVLVVDVGGTNVKIWASAHAQGRQISSGAQMTAAEMVKQVLAITSDWRFDVVSIGYPGVVIDNQVKKEPKNLGEGWTGFNFARAFGRSVRMINDAALQALGSYQGGRMLFLGLGTGLGAALIINGEVQPLELAHLPYGSGGSYEDFVGLRGLLRLGEEEWLNHVTKVASLFFEAFLVEEVVVGGGNAHRLRELPAYARRVDNKQAFVGGVRLWQG